MIDTEKTLLKILEYQNNHTLSYTLNLNEKSFPLFDSKISTSDISTLTNKTRRDDLEYFSNTMVYYLIGSTNDTTIIPLLSNVMLGPNTEFTKLNINTNISFDSKKNSTISILGHLTNTMQTSSKVQLHIMIDDISTS
jgi:hypothetical protein